MTIQRIASLTVFLALLGGCAATIDQGGVEQRTAQAIGRTTDKFTISNRSEETGGRINYSVKTKDGVAYSCYMYSATGFQRAMSFGQTPHSDAICTPMAASQGKGIPARPASPAATGGQRGATPGGECNALLRAAGRC